MIQYKEHIDLGLITQFFSVYEKGEIRMKKYLLEMFKNILTRTFLEIPEDNIEQLSSCLIFAHSFCIHHVEDLQEEHIELIETFIS